MLGQLDRVATEEYDGSTREDVFRRATFNWALATKRMVESSVALGINARVAHAALADIEYARVCLDKLFVPVVTKSPALMSDNDKTVTAQAVQESVHGVTARILAMPDPSKLQDKADEIVDAPQIVRTPQPQYPQNWPDFFRITPQPHSATDLRAPVWPKDGKMLWAGVKCPTCHVEPGQRCITEGDGKPRAKPHTPRKRISEQGQK